jgi:Rieske Fe-S protein
VAQGVQDVDALVPKTPRRGFTGRVRVGTKGELATVRVGSAVTSYSTSEWFFLVRAPEGWLALHNLCTNRGCRLTWEQSLDGQTRLACKSDGSIYDMYGEPVKGPAAYPLEVFALEQDRDGVYVRTDTVRSRLTVDRNRDATRL